MNFSAVIPMGGCICNFLFAVFIFSRAPRATINRVYLVSGLSIATWNLGSYFLFTIPPDQAGAALFWARFLQIGVLYEIAAFIHLSVLIAGYRPGRWIRWLYIFQTFLVGLDLTPYYIAGVRFLGKSGWYAIAGPAFHLINLPYSLSFVSIVLLWRKRKNLPPLQRHRLTTLLGAQALLALLGLNDLLPIIGQDHYPFTHVQVYPIGSIGVVFYGVIVAYSVLHHQLLDVRVALSGALAHIVRFFSLFTITVGILLPLAVFSDAFNALSFTLSVLTFMVSAIIASLLFPRLFGGKGLERWERRITGDHFEYQDQLRSFVANINWYSDASVLLNDVQDLLVRTLRLQRYHLILREETSGIFSLVRVYPEEPLRQIPEVKFKSPIFNYFEWRNAEYLALNSQFIRISDGILERQAREQLASFRAELCLPLSSENEPFGLFLIGPKANSEPYTATDINLLVALTKNLSLVMNQIRLKTQILHAQELDLLGKMSRGMAHDLNNLLTPVWTLLQLSSEDGATEFDEELLPVALRNVKTMRAYIKEALFFSENLRPDLQLGRLDLTIRSAVEVARMSRKKDVQIETFADEETLAEMDEVLLQRLLANLIVNAIDASPPGGNVRVVLERLPKVDPTREWLRIRVIDHGEGIPKENLSRILTPYFTTKNRGDENRGFGLGLAICRKIVTLHGGNLAITSQIRKGTTVQVDLPSRQVKATPTPVVAVTS